MFVLILMAAFAICVTILMFLIINDVYKTVTNVDQTEQEQL